MKEITICCVTYNQAQWISQAINSFLNQKTSIEYEIMIYNHASTDNTESIINEYLKDYPNKIRYIRSNTNVFNQMGIQFMAQKVFPLITSKYVAFCDGDDYWIDPLKLQKQYDFLENNNDYGACYGQVKRYDERTRSFGKLQGAEVNSFEELLEECTITWQTFFLRNELLQAYIAEIRPDIQHPDWSVQDYPLELYVARKFKLFFFKEPMAVFRTYSNSVTHQKSIDKINKYAIGILSIISFYTKDCTEETKTRILARYTSNFMGILIRNKQHRNIRNNLKLFYKAGKRYYIDALCLSVASCFLWFPLGVRALFYLKNKLFPIKSRTYQ